MADSLRTKATERYTDAKAKAADAVAKGKTKAEDAARLAREKAEQAAASTKAGAQRAASATKAGAKKAADKTSQSVETNPLAAIVGGLAVGAIVAALLPRTARENKLAGNVGRTVRDTASKAAKNATATAKDQLDALGVNADAAKGQLRDLISKIGEAATSAGSAAADTVRKSK